jgi:hypothetical protein
MVNVFLPLKLQREGLAEQVYPEASKRKQLKL